MREATKTTTAAKANQSVNHSVSDKHAIRMPCLDISTNVNLDAVDTDPLFSDLTQAVSRIVGVSENLVMILIKGSVGLTFGGTKEAAAFAEIASMADINTNIKRQLISTIGSILETKLCIPKTRFVLKVFNITSSSNSKL
ncbi:uncharacterized protein LOC127250972 [Andrographis paniculata]|uniref:uncharacterized protein LOC127250972 n=1 Tax=Andrographis paniculata TaxID=175694 RepID=UPI0021E7F696|nr:uncharacterized protein LOC127250972 [Andrographis paniculata]